MRLGDLSLYPIVIVPALTAEPPLVVTVIFPVTAPTGTITLNWVLSTAVTLAAATVILPNFTVGFVVTALIKSLPLTVITAPTVPVAGMDEMVGAFKKVKASGLVAVPSDVVTLIFPLEIPAGTLTVIWLAVAVKRSVAKA